MNFWSLKLKNLYQVFLNLKKKSIYRIWHAALWATMQKYNVNANLVCTIEHLYDKAMSAVQIDGSTGKWLRTVVGVRQGCLFSAIRFNIFLTRIMSDALEKMMVLA